MRFLTGLQSLAGRSVHFVDAWRAAGNTGPGYTHSKATAASMIAIGKVEAIAQSNRSCGAACDSPLGSRIASDNFREADHRRRLDYVLLGGPVVRDRGIIYGAGVN